MRVAQHVVWEDPPGSGRESVRVRHPPPGASTALGRPHTPGLRLAGGSAMAITELRERQTRDSRLPADGEEQSVC